MYSLAFSVGVLALGGITTRHGISGQRAGLLPQHRIIACVVRGEEAADEEKADSLIMGGPSLSMRRIICTLIA